MGVSRWGEVARTLCIFDDVSNRIWDRGCFEVFRIDTNDGDISLGGFVAAWIIQDFKVITDGLLAFDLRRQSHANRVPVGNPPGKLCEDLDARHPDVIRLKQPLPFPASGTK